MNIEVLPYLSNELWDKINEWAAILTVRLVPSWYRGEKSPRTMEVPMEHHPNPQQTMNVRIELLFLTGIHSMIATGTRWEHSPVCDNAAFSKKQGDHGREWWVARRIVSRRFQCPDAPWADSKTPRHPNHNHISPKVIAVSRDQTAPTSFKMGYANFLKFKDSDSLEFALRPHTVESHKAALLEFTPMIQVADSDSVIFHVKAVTTVDNPCKVIMGPWQSWLYVNVWVET